jgi:hypothetical protein
LLDIGVGRMERALRLQQPSDSLHQHDTLVGRERLASIEQRQLLAI